MKGQQSLTAGRISYLPSPSPSPFPPFKSEAAALVGPSCWRKAMQSQVAGITDLALVLR